MAEHADIPFDERCEFCGECALDCACCELCGHDDCFGDCDEYAHDEEG